METKTVSINDIKKNPKNPRFIRDEKYEKLLKSIKDFPEMAEAREIIVNKDMVILGGNMRFRAMQEAGWKEVKVKIVDWPESKQDEFVIKDNIGFGDWDWDILANEWDVDELEDWGLSIEDMPDFDPSDEDEQGKLDEKVKVKCPECGYEFEA